MARLKKDGTEAKKTGPAVRYTPEELHAKIDEFLQDCEANKRPPLLPQMLLYLGISKSTMKRWCSKEMENSDAYNEALSMPSSTARATCWSAWYHTTSSPRAA